MIHILDYLMGEHAHNIHALNPKIRKWCDQGFLTHISLDFFSPIHGIDLFRNHSRQNKRSQKCILLCA